MNRSTGTFMSDMCNGPDFLWNGGALEEKDGVQASSESEHSEEAAEDPSSSSTQRILERPSYLVDNEVGVALLLEGSGSHTRVRAWNRGELAWEHKIRGRVEETALADGFVALATPSSLHVLSLLGGYSLFPPMDRDLLTHPMLS